MHQVTITSIPRLIHFLREKWWIPCLVGVAGLAAAAAHAYYRPAEFASIGRLWVSGKLHVAQESFYAEELQNFYGTQVELIKSHTIQVRARAKLDAEHPGIRQKATALQVNQQPKAAVFDVKVVSADGLFAQKFLDALMQSYLAYKTESRTFSSDDTASSLSTQLQAQEKQLLREQEELRDFQTQNNEVVLQERGASVASYLARIQVQLADSRLEAQLLESVINASSSLNKVASPVSLGPEVETLVPGFKGAQQALTPIQQVRFLEMKRAELENYLQPKHPKMLKLDEVIARQKELLHFFQEQSDEQLSSARIGLEKRIKSFEEAIKEWEAKGLDASAKMADHDRVRAAIKRSQALFDRLLELQQSVHMGRKLDRENVSILQPASAPMAVKANLPLRMGLGLVLGILIGLGILYIMERMDDRITSMQILRNSIGDTNVVGQIPEVMGRRTPAMTLLQLGDRRHMFLESYRNIRSSLVFMPLTTLRPKTLLITSAVPDEGKSTVSVNLAQTLALAGGRVLLIDGDLRRGALNALFEIPAAPGLVEVLRDGVEVESAIVKTSRPNLWLLPCGKRCSSPGELLLGASADALLRLLSLDYDYIIMDSAPVLAADDTVSLAPKMDGVVMVVRESFSRTSSSQQALAQLFQRQAKVLGIVLNRVNSNARDYRLYKYSQYFPDTDAAISTN